MESLDFDGMSKNYDKTRSFDENCFNHAINYIKNRFSPGKYRRLLEPGIGNGRVAIPLAREGYNVFGIDISKRMLKNLREKLEKFHERYNIDFKLADTTKIPLSENEFDIVIVVHLFYFIKDWKKAVNEIVRVVNGPIILMHTGFGLEIPYLNKRYKDLCRKYNNPISNIGVESTKQVVEYFEDLGYESEIIENNLWQWKTRITVKEALKYIDERSYSYTIIPSEEIHSRVMQALNIELEKKYESLQKEIQIPNQIYLVIVRKQEKC